MRVLSILTAYPVASLAVAGVLRNDVRAWSDYLAREAGAITPEEIEKRRRLMVNQLGRTL